MNIKEEKGTKKRGRKTARLFLDGQDSQRDPISHFFNRFL